MVDRSNSTQGESEQGTKKGPLENKAVLLGIIVIVQALVAIGLTQYVLVPKTPEIAVSSYSLRVITTSSRA